jgi:hypothetical protein
MSTSNDGWVAPLNDLVESGELCHRICSGCGHDRYFFVGDLVNCPLCGGKWIDADRAERNDA